MGWVARPTPYRHLGAARGGAEPSLRGSGRRDLLSLLLKAQVPIYPAVFNDDWPPLGSALDPLDQGDSMMCVAYASCAAIEDRLTRTNFVPQRLSPRRIHLCINGVPPINGLPDYLLTQSLMQHGAPVDPGNDSAIQWPSDCATHPPPPAVIGVADLVTLPDAAYMKAAIADRGAIVAIMEEHDDFLYHYVDGVYRPIQTGAPFPAPARHAVAVVGYSDAGQFWVCRNSRGTLWGQGGYFQIAYGACGIGTTQPAFEILLS